MVDSLSRRRLLKTTGTVATAAIATGATIGTGSLSGCLGLFGGDLPECEGDQITDASLPAKGATDAPVTVAVYSDYACSHCATWALEKAPELADEIEQGRIRYVHHDFPIPVSDRSMPAANAARAVHYHQGAEAFWTYNRLLFENQKSLDTDSLADMAGEAGVSPETARSAAETLPFCQAITDDRSAASDRGVSGTPTVFVEDEKFVNPSVKTVRTAIDDRV
jgi:protein-disulfide isomerase